MRFLLFGNDIINLDRITSISLARDPNDHDSITGAWVWLTDGGNGPRLFLDRTHAIQLYEYLTVGADLIDVRYALTQLAAGVPLTGNAPTTEAMLTFPCPVEGCDGRVWPDAHHISDVDEPDRYGLGWAATCAHRAEIEAQFLDVYIATTTEAHA